MRRKLAAAVLICAFIVLGAYYTTNVTYHVDMPREREVSANYEAYVGQTSRSLAKSSQRGRGRLS